MKWLVLVLMIVAGAVLGPLLLLFTAVCFLCSAALAGLLVLADSRRGPHVYESRH